MNCLNLVYDASMPVPTLTIHNAAAEMDRAAHALPPYPGGPRNFAGRGVVIPGGGTKYFPSAYVCIRMLRHVGCTLPVELWHLGPDEMSDEMRAIVEPLGVTCVDAHEVRQRYPVRAGGSHAGWELKPYSIIHSRFREVLFFDADNMPVVDPTFLFDAPQYREHGAIFWPDPFIYMPEDIIWKLTGVPHRKEWQFESGQIVVDKQRCWKPLLLTLWMNEHADFWYQHIYGDKDTFHMAWRKLGYEYAMPEKGYQRIQGVMCHHDFDGRRIFQHRHGHKWAIDGWNAMIPGFRFEDECRSHITDLRASWRNRPGRPFIIQHATADQRRFALRLCSHRWREQHENGRFLSFGPDGFVHEGANDHAHTWNLLTWNEGLALAIQSSDGKALLLYPNTLDDWTHFGRATDSSQLLTIETDWPHRPYDDASASDELRAAARELCGVDWIYRRLRHDQKRLSFGIDGYIREGADCDERAWFLKTTDDGLQLAITGRHGITCGFRRTTPNRWQGRWLVGSCMATVLVPATQTAFTRIVLDHTVMP